MRRLNIFLLCSFITIFCGTQTNTTASEVDEGTLNGNGFSACGSYLKVFGQISATDLRHLANKNIQCIETKEDSTEALFSQHQNFCHLQKVTLDSKHNSLQLIALAENFPDIESLTYKQQYAIVESDLKSLGKIKTLQYLALQGYVSNLTLVGQNIPDSINSLNIDIYSYDNLLSPPILRLPNLRKLVINHETLNEGFFKSMRAPMLEEIEFNHVNFLPGAIINLKLFTNLKNVVFTDTTCDAEELQDFEHALPSLNISSDNNIRRQSTPSQADNGADTASVNDESAKKFLLSVDRKICRNWPGHICTWRNPPRLAFRIWKDGQVSDLRVVSSSGYNFDDCIMTAVRRASPFTDFPYNSNFVDVFCTPGFSRSLVEPTKGIFRRY